MYLEIVTPEAILLSSEVDSISVPGVNGKFQILNNHAPIVSNLTKGSIEIAIHSQNNIKLNELHNSIKHSENDDKVLVLKINSGTIELNENKAIILAD